MNQDKYNVQPLDDEERELMDAMNHPDFEPKTNKEALKRYREAVTQRISLTVQAKDIELYKEKARKLGVPYQTLATSVFHRYITDPDFEKMF